MQKSRTEAYFWYIENNSMKLNKLYTSYNSCDYNVKGQEQLSLNAGQKYCRILQWEHSAMLLPLIKISIVNKIFVLSIFEWQFYTGFIAY